MNRPRRFDLFSRLRASGARFRDDLAEKLLKPGSVTVLHLDGDEVARRLCIKGASSDI